MQTLVANVARAAALFALCGWTAPLDLINEIVIIIIIVLLWHKVFSYNNGGDLRKINGGFAWLPNIKAVTMSYLN